LRTFVKRFKSSLWEKVNKAWAEGEGHDDKRGWEFMAGAKPKTTTLI